MAEGLAQNVQQLSLGGQGGQEAGDNEGVMRIGKRCFVSNLAWKTSWQDLKDKFRECGNVVYANVHQSEEGRSKGWGIVEFETPEEAVRAVETLNGTDLAGRKILVREDREDKDVKNYNRENGIEEPVRPPRERRPRRERPPREEGAEQEAPARRERPPRERRERAPRPEPQGESSGLQIVVQGLPWAFTNEDLDAMFKDYQPQQAQIVIGRDGRSRGYGTVRFETTEKAEAAINAFHQTDLQGRTLAVRMDRFA